jgi:hypothetical protein
MIPERGGIVEQPQSVASMIKSLSALAIFGFLGAIVVALPGFAAQVEARETVALAKADRLDIRNCSQQLWPNFDTSCLRSSESGLPVLEVRLATARR